MSFTLDNFKREYTNGDKEIVLKYLNENCDFKNFKFYHAKFNSKYDDIPTISFVRANRINGYFQQFDNDMHKIAFGVGSYKNNELNFVWLLDMKNGFPNVLKDSTMYENFDWHEVDKDNEIVLSILFDEKEEAYIFK